MISKFYRKRFYTIAKNVCNNNSLYEDLHSETVMLIYEKKYDLTIIRSFERFFVTCCWLTWHSNKFRKKYFSNFDELNFKSDQVTYLEYIEKSYTCDSLIHFLKKSPTDKVEWYEQELMKKYIEFGDAMKLSKASSIPYRTVANDIKEIKHKLKQAHYEENTDKS